MIRMKSVFSLNNQILMKNSLWTLLLLFLLFSCRNPKVDFDQVSCLAADREILEQVFQYCSADQDMSTSALMVRVGSFFLGTPYVAHTLESGEEHLVINLREMDCTTFAENCLALTRTIKSGSLTFERFASSLQAVRYRDGKIRAYPSRLHYFCDWIYNNDQKRLIRDMSEELAHTSLRKQINFMSTHPESYPQLKENPEFVEALAAQEAEIDERKMFYIPENRIAELEDQLMEGDIAGITTEIDGLAIQHVVILIRKGDRIHMLHASSTAEKVVVSDQTLEEYLLESKSASGIMLARPL